MHIRKVTTNITTAPVLRNGRSPARRIRVASLQIRGRRSSREEPDADDVVCPFHSNNSATDGVEIRAIGLRLLVLKTAACVGALASCANVAVGRGEGASEGAVARDGTALAGVEGHGVVGIVIDAF